MAKYTYTGKKTFSLAEVGEDGIRKQAANGDVVELTDSQYEAFKDVFAPVVKAAPAPAAPAPEGKK